MNIYPHEAGTRGRCDEWRATPGSVLFFHQPEAMHAEPYREPPPRGATEQFDAAIAKVTDERGKVYGHPADDFAKVAHMAQAIEDCADPRIKHALYMILVKVARLAETPDHVDSWIDVAGYARTGVMILDRK